MAQPVKDKDDQPARQSVRDHLEAAARMGSVAARQELAGAPVCPEQMEYLVEWAYALHGRSGLGMSGVAPLGYDTVASWAGLTGVEVDPLEVEALMHLDAAIRTPEQEDGAGSDPTPEPVQRTGAWPTRRAEPEMAGEG